MRPTFKETLSWICCLKLCFLIKISDSTGTGLVAFPSNWNKCITLEPFLKARVGSVQQCIQECQLRQVCRSVNYFRRSGFCELLNTSDTTNLTLNTVQQPCVSISKPEIPELPDCSSCEEHEVCVPSSSTCEIKECPQLDPLEKGTLHGNRQSVSAVAKIVCGLNYRPEYADGRAVCQANGTWSPASCVPEIVCSPLSPVTNATMVVSGDMTPGTVVTYTCDIGTVLTPNDANLLTFECQQDTTWSQAIVFQCLEVCDTPPLVNNTQSTTSGDLIPGATVTYTCDAGFVVNSNDISLLTLTCQPDITWSAVGFECVVDCHVPPNDPFATLDTGKTGVNTVRTYTCNNLYITASGSPTYSVTCQSDGTWSSTNGTCLRDCLSPPVITSGSFTSGTTYEGSVGQYSCDPGYVLQIDGVVAQVTTASVTCQSDGQWSATVQCVADCSDPPGEQFSTLIAGTTYAGSVRTYECYNLYITDTGATTFTITCQADGSWTSSTETCLRDCSNPSSISSGSVGSGLSHEGAVRQVSCNSGYTAHVDGAATQSSTAIVTCQSNGQWSATIQCVLGCAPGTESDLVSAIADSQITASSYWDSNYEARFGRLDNAKAWSPGSQDTTQYIQFNFNANKVVTGITTQGFDTERASQYIVKYSMDCSTFTDVTNNVGQTEQFAGNTDDDSHVSHTFSSPIQARCVRVNPTVWDPWPAMRVALIGC